MNFSIILDSMKLFDFYRQKTFVSIKWSNAIEGIVTTFLLGHLRTSEIPFEIFSKDSFFLANTLHMIQNEVLIIQFNIYH